MTTHQIPPALRAVKDTWAAGARTAPEVATFLGISRGAAKSRVARARRAGLIGPAPSSTAADPAPPSRFATMALATLAAGGWRVTEDALLVTVGGDVVAEWIPRGRPRLPSRDHLDAPAAYEPDPILRVELLKLAAEVAQALAEIEEIALERRPGSRPVTTQRVRRANARRMAWLSTTRGPEPGTTQETSPQ